MLCLKPPNPTFCGGFFIITLHEQSPIFKGHFFKQNYINLLPNFQGNFFRNLLSRRIFKNTFDRTFFFTKSPSMIEACLFLRNSPPHPQVKDCLPVSLGRGWGSRSSLNTTTYISTDLPSNFCKQKIGDFLLSVNLWWIITKLKTDGLFLILKSGLR